MNELIRNQLTKVRVAIIPDLPETATKLVIPRSIKFNLDDLVEGFSCLLEVADYIINPPDGFDLHLNWNNNIIPTFKCMKCTVTKLIGKMIKVKAIAYDLSSNQCLEETWEGWLPKKSIVWIRSI